MNNNIQTNWICPVCNKNMIEAPNGVCSVCYGKLKKKYIHSYEFWDKWEKDELENMKILFNPEIHEQNVRRVMERETNEWSHIVRNGLSAVQVLIDILDNVDAETGTDADIVWHRRRVCFMKDMVEQLGDSYFTPATSQQISDFTQSAIDFWNGRISKYEAKNRYEDMKRILQKDDITRWDSKSFLLWMIQEEDFFDWMWGQWFECLYACYSEPCNDNIWINLFHKHFSIEIKSWVNGTTINMIDMQTNL